jgi:hypothetical protein
MRATKSSVFIQAIIIALLAFKHEWAVIVGVLGVLHLIYHWLSAPKLVPVNPGLQHQAAVSPHQHTYRLHRGAHPAPPENPQPGSRSSYTQGSWE